MALRPYLRLARVQTAGFTATIPAWGYLVARVDELVTFTYPGPPSFPPLLLVVGACAHIFGSIDNEICDRAIDERATFITPKPLISGEVSLRAARILSLVFLAAGLAAAAVVASTTSPDVLLLTAGAAGAAAAYNRWGKRFLGGELLFSASLALFFLAGAAAYRGSPIWSDPITLWFGGLAFLTLSFQVVFVGGGKDMETDAQSGLRTFAAVATKGRAAVPAEAPVRSPRSFFAGAVALQLAILAVALYSLLYVIPSPLPEEWLAYQVATVAIAAALRLFMFKKALAAQERRRRVRLLAASEGLQLPLFAALIIGWLSAEELAVLVAVPVLLVVGLNRAVFGTIAAPDV